MTTAASRAAGPCGPLCAHRARRSLGAVLSAAALMGAAACGAEEGPGVSVPSAFPAEVSADARAAPSPRSSAGSGSGGLSESTTTGPASATADESASSSEASAPEDPDEIVASVPGNFRGSDSSTLAPGEAERVLPGMRAAVVPAKRMPGKAVTAERVQEMPDVPFSQPLPLEGVEPSGGCREVVERIDAATVPHTVLLHTGYEVDPGVSTVLGPEASVGSFLVYTPSTEDLVGAYGALPEACGTLEGEDGTTVEFSAVEGVPGAVLVSSSGPRGDSVVTLGGASAGHRHLSAAFVQVEPAAAGEMLRAQVQAFRAAG